ncbi:MAG TPA: DUF2892 domain-containing protein [Bacteroidia bacterium]|nr:DUF2892 domain-containing protein [Bacteroidia bacterium]HNU33500.1 DUF2892 domain-containing protein [Bacteroidia bacterium]
MKANAGMDDRVIRMFIGIIIVSVGIVANSIWAALGIPVFLSGAIGICPLYSLIGINTNHKQA